MIIRITALAATLALGLSTMAIAADATYQLVPQGGSGEAGTITIAPAPGGGSLVTVVTTGQGADPQPVHVHKGPCLVIDPKPAYPLATLEKGKSVTTLKGVTPAQLTDGSYAINVHKSTKEGGIYVACATLTKM
jgi:hypothetical protein